MAVVKRAKSVIRSCLHLRRSLLPKTGSKVIASKIRICGTEGCAIRITVKKYEDGVIVTAESIYPKILRLEGATIMQLSAVLHNGSRESLLAQAKAALTKTTPYTWNFGPHGPHTQLLALFLTTFLDGYIRTLREEK